VKLSKKYVKCAEQNPRISRYLCVGARDRFRATLFKEEQDMKNKLCILLCLLLAFALPLAAFAEAEETDLQLEGFVTEIVDGGFVMEDIERGKVMLNVSEETVWDGMASQDGLSLGQYVLVDFDGRMTFSLPPQAHADRVGMYTLEGMVAEVYEDGMLLQGDPIYGDVIVNFAEAMPHVHQGMIVTVWYDGVMALSLPGQVTAKHITVPELVGTVSELAEDGFLLTDESGVPYQVLLTDEMIIGLKPVETVEETAEETEEETAEEPAEEEAEEVEIEISEEPVRLPLEQSDVELADGDKVTVYYNGMLSRSIPAQLTALEIAVEK